MDRRGLLETVRRGVAKMIDDEEMMDSTITESIQSIWQYGQSFIRGALEPFSGIIAFDKAIIGVAGKFVERLAAGFAKPSTDGASRPVIASIDAALLRMNADEADMDVEPIDPEVGADEQP